MGGQGVAGLSALQNALQLGFKIIRFPRIGMISNPVIEQLPPERMEYA